MAGAADVVAALARSGQRRHAVGAGAQRQGRRAGHRCRRRPLDDHRVGVAGVQREEHAPVDRAGLRGHRRRSAPRHHDAVLDAVISCCFGSPFDGEQITPERCRRARRPGPRRRRRPGHARRHDGDGDAAPCRTRCSRPPGATSVCTSTTPAAPRCSTPGQRSNVGVDRFDTALGGLGGSPFAPTAGGNLATEDLAMVLADCGVDTGIDLDALLAAGPLLAELVGHTAEPSIARRVVDLMPAARFSGHRPTTPGRRRRSGASPRSRGSTTSTP